MTDHISVLDHGYVRYIDHMGSDLSVVNAARASFMKESDAWTPSDHSLLEYLARKDEYSPFRHAIMTFEVYAPLMVARQWWKYIVGHHHDPFLAWNESSRRYVTEEPVYYTPEFRSAPENKKQGSSEPVDPKLNERFQGYLKDLQDCSIEAYQSAIQQGIAPEQARVFLLGYGLYVRWRWTSSLEGIKWFLRQRRAPEAQSEIQQYAEAVHQLAFERFPVSVGG
jgi:thymidylate synthase (FAD)